MSRLGLSLPQIPWALGLPLFVCSQIYNVTLFQGKRGIEKQPFQLPDFIAATGIEKIRQVTCFLYLSNLLLSLLIQFFFFVERCGTIHSSLVP
jgi:hypothetical protein